jgi:adenine phosphoribosyltransferase
MLFIIFAMKKMNTTLKDKIRSIPDFPIAHITFRDITPLMQDGKAFHEACDILYERYKDQKIDKVAGIDARGFIFASVLAYRLGVGFIPVRKKGKLPFKTVSEKYELEYGTAEVEMHIDAIKKGERIVVVDDLIASGGTVSAAVKIIERLGGNIVECAFIIRLTDLKGSEKIKDHKVFAIVDFEGK